MSAQLPFWAEVLGWSLVHLVWEATLVAIATGWLLRLAAEDATLRYQLSYCALLVIAVLPFATAASIVLMQQPDAGTVSYARSIGIADIALPELGGPLPELLPWFLSAWITGVVTLGARAVLGYGALAKAMRSDCKVAPAALARAVGEQARMLGIRTRVQTRESDCISTPLTVGWRRPTVVFPAVTIQAIEPTHLQAIIAHEVAHVHRKDFAANLIQIAAEILVFFHPATWWLGRVARREREYCTDQLAARSCGSQLRYARALVTLEQSRMRPFALAQTFHHAPLGERVDRIVRRRPTSRFKRRLITCLAVSVACLALLAAGAVMSAQAADLHWSRTAPRVEISAMDPAGEFTVSLKAGRVLGATLDRMPLPSARLRQVGDSIRFLSSTGNPIFSVRVKPGGQGITWAPRAPRRTG